MKNSNISKKDDKTTNEEIVVEILKNLVDFLVQLIECHNDKGLEFAKKMIKLAGGHSYSSISSKRFKDTSLLFLNQFSHEDKNYVEYEVGTILSNLRIYIIAELNVQEDVAIRAFRAMTLIFS